MPHPALSDTTNAYQKAATAHSLLFETRASIEQAIEMTPESDWATLEQLNQALTQVRQVLDSTLPLAETLRQAFRLVRKNEQ